MTSLRDQAERISELEREVAEQRMWKETAYTERAMLVALLTRIYPSWLADHDPNDASWDPEWKRIVFVLLPSGQCSWHVHVKDAHLFAHVPYGGNQWDKHTTEEKYKRVLAVRRNSTHV